MSKVIIYLIVAVALAVLIEVAAFSIWNTDYAPYMDKPDNKPSIGGVR
jgi:Flp pilus assembly protein CpaB